MTAPAGIAPEAWAEAVRQAGTDRLTLARLVERGRVSRVRGTWAIALPSTRNLAIRPSRKHRKVRR